MPNGWLFLAGAVASLIIVDRTIFTRIRALDPTAFLTVRPRPNPLDPIETMISRLGAAFAAERRRASNAYADADRRVAEFELSMPVFIEAARAEFAGKLRPALRALADGDLTAQIDAPEVQAEFDATVLLFAKTVFAFATSAGAIGAQVGDIATRAEALASRSQEEGGRYAPAREALRAVALEAERAAEDQSRSRSQLRAAAEAYQTALHEGAGGLEKVATERAKIAEIAEAVDSFSFQAHLIAVNASVEAAHAGEAGRGFAIIAKELRALSQRASASTQGLVSRIDELANASARRARALREAAQVVGELTPAGDAPVMGLLRFRPAEAALEAAEQAARRNAEAADGIARSGHSLNALVAKLAKLAGHFRFGEQEADEAPAPQLRPAPRLMAS